MKKPIRATHGVKNNYSRVLDRIHDILNGGIDLGGLNNPSNANLTHVTTQTPGTTNTDFTVTHNLGRVPTGFITVNPANNVVLWKGSVAWTDTQMTLQASAINVPVTLLIY